MTLSRGLTKRLERTPKGRRSTSTLGPDKLKSKKRSEQKKRDQISDIPEIFKK
jgi:hypothetical protein